MYICRRVSGGDASGIGLDGCAPKAGPRGHDPFCHHVRVAVSTFSLIAWLYREDYERGGVRMLPVVDSDGKSTVWRILAYSAALIPVSLLPVALGMAGRVYVVGAILMGMALFRVSMGMAYPRLLATDPASKPQARRLLLATILYLPALFALMMANSGS
jgi:protoheme IX farnesyltransferase